MAAGSDSVGEKSFAGAGASMGVSAGTRLAGTGESLVGHSVRNRSALVETRSTRLTLTSFLNSCKGGRSKGTAQIIVPGTARTVIIKPLTVVRFMSGFLLEGSWVKPVCGGMGSYRDVALAPRTTKTTACGEQRQHEQRSQTHKRNDGSCHPLLRLALGKGRPAYAGAPCKDRR